MSVSKNKPLYIEVAPGASIVTDLTSDGWLSMKIIGEVTYVSDEPSPETIVSSRIVLEDSDLYSQKDSYVNNPEEDEHNYQ